MSVHFVVRFTKTIKNNNSVSCLILHFYIQHRSIEINRNFIKQFLTKYKTIEVINKLRCARENIQSLFSIFIEYA